MFGKRKPTIVNVHQPMRTEYVTREVVEKRAPTDESVALLREMEAAASAKLLSSVRIDNTIIDIVVSFERDMANAEFIARATTKINGKKITVVARDDGRLDKYAILHKLRDELSREIAAQIIGDAMANVALPY